ncbi:MAG TPA: hypothetical protein VIG25_15425 [Pyrinomonadaceae bacterium]
MKDDEDGPLRRTTSSFILHPSSFLEVLAGEHLSPNIASKPA